MWRFWKKRSWHRRFSVNVTKFLRTPFLQNNSGGCSCKELMKFNCCLSSIITGSYVKQGPNLSWKLFLSSFYSLQFLLLQDKIFIALISNQRWMHENLNGKCNKCLENLYYKILRSLQPNNRKKDLKRRNVYLKVQPCKLDNSKYITVSGKTTNTKIFAFRAVLGFKLLSRKVLSVNRKDNRNC